MSDRPVRLFAALGATALFAFSLPGCANGSGGPRDGGSLSAAATPDSPAAIDLASAPSHTGSGPEGIFTRQNPVGIMIGTTYVYNTENYVLYPDGLIYNGVPQGGPEFFDMTKARQTQPDKCGTYVMSADKLDVTWGNGAKASLDVETGGDGKPVLKGFQHPARYDAGQKWEGNWVHTGGDSAVGNAQALSFHADGSFTSSNVGYVSADSPDGTTLGGGSQGSKSGTYQVSGNTLSVTFADGSSGRKTIYSMDPPTSSKPSLLYVDGVDFSLEK